QRDGDAAVLAPERFGFRDSGRENAFGLAVSTLLHGPLSGLHGGLPGFLGTGGQGRRQQPERVQQKRRARARAHGGEAPGIVARPVVDRDEVTTLAHPGPVPLVCDHLTPDGAWYTMIKPGRYRHSKETARHDAFCYGEHGRGIRRLSRAGWRRRSLGEA